MAGWLFTGGIAVAALVFIVYWQLHLRRIRPEAPPREHRARASVAWLVASSVAP
jgi:hypothetical protein